MNIAPNTPNIIPNESSPSESSHSALRGREVQLTWVAHSRDNRVLLRFKMENEEYIECFVRKPHWQFLEEIGNRCPVMVAKYPIEQGAPIHMFWRFPVPIDAEFENYRYYTYTDDSSSEIAEALGADLLEAGTFTGWHARRQRWL